MPSKGTCFMLLTLLNKIIFAHLAVRFKAIDGVEQLTRYLELLGRDPLLTPVTGVFAAQQIKPQARTLAQDRGIRWWWSTTTRCAAARAPTCACSSTSRGARGRAASGTRAGPGRARGVGKNG